MAVYPRHETDTIPAALGRPMPRWLRALVIFAVVLGIALRFTNLSHKAYWLDEAFTAFHVSGYSDNEAKAQLVTGKVIPNGEFWRFQSPNAEKGPLDTATHIALTSPELPPPYFLALRGWVSLWGPSVTSLRLFSVVLSLLLLPAIYWLCRELFPGSWVGAVAVALVAQSPFHLLYAQEARPYSLWTLLIVLSSGALLRALRCQTQTAWAIYSLTLAAGLYCHLLHGLVILGHGFFMLWQEWGQWGKSLRRGPLGRFVLAGLVTSLLFAPWVIFALVNFDNFQTTQPSGVAPGLVGVMPKLIKGWVKGWNLTLLDFNADGSGARLPMLGLALLLGANLVWMAIALWRFAITGQGLAKKLLFSQILVTALLLVGPDFVLDGTRSHIFRYWLPVVLSLQLAMAFVLTRWLVLGPRRWGQLLLVGLLTMGLVSNSVMVMSWDWWSKSEANANLELPALVRQYRESSLAGATAPGTEPAPESVTGPGSETGTGAKAGPLFVSDQFFVHALAASHLLPADAQWLLVQEGQMPSVPSDYGRLFYLYAPSPALLDHMQQQYQVTPVNDAYWQVSRR
jgi:uncharacterized membrane protein